MRHEYSDMHTVVFMVRALNLEFNIVQHLLSIDSIYEISVRIIISIILSLCYYVLIEIIDR